MKYSFVLPIPSIVKEYISEMHTAFLNDFLLYIWLVYGTRESVYRFSKIHEMMTIVKNCLKLDDSCGI